MADSGTWDDLSGRMQAIGEESGTTARWWRLWSCLIGHPWYRAALAVQGARVARCPRSLQHHAADLQQEAVLLLARDLQQSWNLQTELTGGGPQLSGLLIRITVRHLLQARRRLVREVGRQQPLTEEVPISPATSVSEARRAVSRWIPLLPAEQRAALALTLNGLTQAEIAERLAVHQSTVSRRLSGAIANLRAHWASDSSSSGAEDTSEPSAEGRRASAIRAWT